VKNPIGEGNLKRRRMSANQRIDRCGISWTIQQSGNVKGQTTISIEASVVSLMLGISCSFQASFELACEARASWGKSSVGTIKHLMMHF